MNRERQLLEFLQLHTVLSMDQLQQHLAVSERLVHELLRSLRKQGPKNGFTIRTISGEGYQLLVQEEALFTRFVQKDTGAATATVLGRDKRLQLLLYYLLQGREYLPLQKLAELLDVNRNTLLLDLPALRAKLAQEHLQLLSRAGYGLKLGGEEFWFRRAFRHYVLESEEYTTGTQEFMDFLRRFPFEDMQAQLEKILEKYGIYAEQAALKSILLHVKILIYRVERGNYINDFHTRTALEDKYLQAAGAIITVLEEKCHMHLPELEQKYLAVQIAGRTSLAEIPLRERLQELSRIHQVLQQLDAKFSTSFAQDKQLEEGLELHMYPLLKRIAFQMELENPLIDLVSSKYANVFLVALRFSELWQDLEISRDELGYLALHFASYLERRKQQIFNRVRRILCLGALRGGGRFLWETRLEELFPKAEITFAPALTAAEVARQEADLVLVTPELAALNCPKVVVQALLSEEDVEKLKLEVLCRAENTNQQEYHLQSLFKPELFAIEEAPQDYVAFLRSKAEQMVRLGLAEPGYPESVVRREEKFSTIYKNGVAGPHGMELSAKVNTIGFYRFRKPLLWQGQKVQTVFLLNIKRGQLFLYKEISDLLLTFMEDEGRCRRLQKTQNFEELLHLLAEEH